MKEKISSLVDDELDDPILQQELDALGRGGAELEAFERYNRIGAAMRGELPASDGFADGAIAARIANALKQEPTRIAPAVVAQNIQEESSTVNRGSTSSGWLGAAAIAATVAAVVVFGLNSGPIEPVTPDTPQIAVNDTAPTTSTAVEPSGDISGEIVKWDTGGTHWEFVSGDSAIAQVADNGGVTRNANGVNAALNAMLVEHAEFVPASGMNGLAAYARFVSYDSDSAKAN